jgi:hypothetical protein
MYASKTSFVKHMKFLHHMYCNFDVIRGQKRTTDQVRPKPKPAGKLKQSNENAGNHGAWVFGAKKNKFKTYANKGLRGFYLNKIRVKTDTEKWMFCQKYAEKLYKQWLNSDLFLQTLNLCLTTTQYYWFECDPRVNAETEA